MPSVNSQNEVSLLTPATWSKNTQIAGAILAVALVITLVAVATLCFVAPYVGIPVLSAIGAGTLFGGANPLLIAGGVALALALVTTVTAIVLASRKVPLPCSLSSTTEITAQQLVDRFGFSDQRLSGSVNNLSSGVPGVPNLGPHHFSGSLFAEHMRNHWMAKFFFEGDLVGAIEDLFQKKLLLDAVKAILLDNSKSRAIGEAREFIESLFKEIQQQAAQERVASHADVQEALSVDEKNMQREILIAHLLSIYIFLSPENGKALQLPTLVNGEGGVASWQLVSYSVEVIDLTPLGWMVSPLQALALTPDSSAPTTVRRQLVFKGTNYPGDPGYLLSIFSDLNPFGGVGGLAYSFSKSRLQQWLNDDVREVQVTGASLGGSLAQKLAINEPEKVKRAIAIVPAGLSSYDRRCAKQQEENDTEVTVVFQGNDLVQNVDRLSDAKNWRYFRILTELDVPAMNHACILSAFRKSVWMEVDAAKSEKRLAHWGWSLVLTAAVVVLLPVAMLLLIASIALRILWKPVDLLSSLICHPDDGGDAESSVV